MGGNEIYEAIKNADPVSQIYGYKENGSRQVRYEKIKNGPENFIAFGDSVSAFNPFYGQGITIAAIGATLLNKSLRDLRRKPTKDLIGFAKEFQKRIAKVNSFPWYWEQVRIFAGQLLKVKVLTFLLGYYKNIQIT